MPTSTVENAVVHRFMGASTSASSFFDCTRHAASQRYNQGARHPKQTHSWPSWESVTLETSWLWMMTLDPPPNHMQQ